jgi:ferredoxin
MNSERVGSPAESTPSCPGGTAPILDRRSGSTYSKLGRSEPTPTVTIHGEKAVEVEAGKKLVLAIEDAGIDILHRCGGNARCTTCRVEVLDGSVPPMGEVEKERLAREGDLAPNIRLSCQIHVESDVEVRVINRSQQAGIPPGPRPAD